MSEQKEVPLLTGFMAACLEPDQPYTTREEKELGEALDAIATGDAATYNTHTHVAVPRGEIEAKDARIAELERIEARYNWLRERGNPANDIALATYFGGSRMQDFDALIDAAIAGETK